MVLSNELKIAIVVNLIIFMIFSYGGATYEHLAYFFDQSRGKVLTNAIVTGFSIYGLGAFAMVGADKLLKPKNLLWRFLLYTAVGTGIEYAGGLIVGAGPSDPTKPVQSWDYSHIPFNYKGIISLKHAVVWGLSGFVVVAVYDHTNKFLTCAFQENCHK